MKRFLLLIPASLALFLSGCMNFIPLPNQPTESGNTTTPIVTGQQTQNMSKEYIVSLSGSTHPSLSFALDTGDIIKLVIQSPAPQAVIRVTQIISPDGSADGPFSSDTVFTAPTQGTYKFLIGPNLMASNEVYTGNVTVIVSGDFIKP